MEMWQQVINGAAGIVLGAIVLAVLGACWNLLGRVKEF